MWYIWIISSGLISIISVCVSYILNKDNIEKQIDYKNTFITIMIVSLIIISCGQVNTEQLVPNIIEATNKINNNKVPF